MFDKISKKDFFREYDFMSKEVKKIISLYLILG